MKASELKVGQAVIFTKVPKFSYLDAETKYIVESIEKKDIYFRNALTGSGSFERTIHLTHFEFEAAKFN